MKLAQPDRLSAALAGDVEGGIGELTLGLGAGLGQDPAVIEERHRHDASSEETAPDHHQRKDAGDLA